MKLLTSFALVVVCVLLLSTTSDAIRLRLDPKSRFKQQVASASASATEKQSVESRVLARLSVFRQFFDDKLKDMKEKCLPDAQKRISEDVVIRNIRMEAAIGIAASNFPGARSVTKEIVQRIVLWRLAQNDVFPKLHDKAEAKKAVAELLSVPGAPTDTGNFKNFQKGKSGYVLSSSGTPEEQMNAGLAVFDEILNSGNSREAAFLLSRITDCGEMPADKPQQKGCLRWIIQEAYKDLAANGDTSPLYKRMHALGFNYEHLKKEFKLVFGRDLVRGASLDGLTLTTSVTNGMISALSPVISKFRPNDPLNEKQILEKALADKKDIQTILKEDGRGARYKFERPEAGKLTSNILREVGMPPLSPREVAGLGEKGGDVPLGWEVGGLIFQMNPHKEVVKQWLSLVMKEKMTAASGPSGTTDKFFQLLDYAGLQHNPTRLKEMGLLVTSNMEVQFHHTLWEMLQGAGCDDTQGTATNVAGRGFPCAMDEPLDNFLLIPSYETTCVADFSLTMSATVPPLNLNSRPCNTYTGTETIMAATLKVFSKLCSDAVAIDALRGSDFPDHNTNLATKGPHVWNPMKEAELNVKVADVQECICNNDKFAVGTTYRQLYCNERTARGNDFCPVLQK